MLSERLHTLLASMRKAAERAGRAPESVTLLAVSKGHDVSAIRDIAALGQLDIGENYVQEMQRKQAACADLSNLRWHFIGHLQRNKAKDLAGRVGLIHGVDDVRVAQAIDNRTPEDTTQPILLQVNVGREPQKSGVLPEELGTLIAAVQKMTRVRLDGLMTVPPAADDPRASRPHFRALAELARSHGLATLSMGMSDDYEVAIEEGATLIRVGTALFGPRAPPAPRSSD